jgi:hypothetical protein
MFDISKKNKTEKPKETIEVEAKKELTEVERKFRESSEKYRATMKDLNDSNFWTCIVFQSKEQAQEFNERMGFSSDSSFIDGLKLAKEIGVEIKSPTPSMPRFKIDKSYQKLIR